MKKVPVLCFSLVCLVSFMSFSGCKWNPTEPISWDSDVLLPIAFSSVNLTNAVNDSSIISEDPDGLLRVVYRDTVFEAFLADLLEVPDTSLLRNFDLKTFELADQIIERRISLGQVARQLSAQGNIIGDIILLNHNNTIPQIPATQGLSSGPVPIDASDLFEFADLTQGNLEIAIINEFPLDISNVAFILTNQTLGDDLVEDFYPSIPSQDSVIRNYDIGGRQVESALNAEITNLDVAGGTDVMIDTAAEIVIRLTISKIKAREARAIFPAQVVDSDSLGLVYEFPEEYADVALTKIGLKQGRIAADIISTIEDTIQFFYSLPSVTRDGEIPSIQRKLQPAPPGGQYVLTENVDLAGFLMDLTMEGTTVNTIQQFYEIALVYSGNLITINLEDSIKLDLGLKDIEPNYVEGYLGTDVWNFSEAQNIDIFDSIDIESLDFSAPEVRLVFQNSIGMNMLVRVNQLQGYNSLRGNSLDLNSAPLQNAIIISGPMLPDTNAVVSTSIDLNRENSNLRDFLGLIPDEVFFDIDAQYNFDSSPFARDNFATDKSAIRGMLEFEIPLEGSASGLVLTDTVDLDFGGTDVDGLNEGTFTLLFDNQFPLEMVVNAGIFDAFGNLVDVVAEGSVIAAGELNTEGFVDLPARSEIQKTYTQEEVNRIIAEGSYLIINYSLATRPQGQPVKLFSDYKLDARLTAAFNYTFNQ